MFEAFNKDKSKFKFYFLIKVVLGLVFCVGAVFLSFMYIDAHTDNNNKRATYASEREWINSFDYRKALRIQKEIVSPCKQTEVMNIVRAHTDLFKANDVFIKDIVNSDFKSGQSSGKGKSALKYITTTVSIDGSWEGIRNSLNLFEKDDFVVVTHCKLSHQRLKADAAQMPTVSGTIVFRTYYH